MSALRTAPLRFAPVPGEWLAGDRLVGDRMVWDHGIGDHGVGRAPGYLFLPGLGSQRQGIKSDSLFAHAAAQGRAAVRIDQRGHGESSGRLGDVTIRELIDDVVALLSHLGPTILVGSSLGGLVAGFAAARRPDLVRGLAMIAPAFGFLAHLEQLLDAEGRLHTSSGQAVSISARVLADAKHHDERSLPANLVVPTLIVHGTADAVVPYQASAAFHAALAAPHRDLWLVPEGCHRLHTVADAIWPRLDALVAAAT